MKRDVVFFVIGMASILGYIYLALRDAPFSFTFPLLVLVAVMMILLLTTKDK